MIFKKRLFFTFILHLYTLSYSEWPPYTKLTHLDQHLISVALQVAVKENQQKGTPGKSTLYAKQCDPTIYYQVTVAPAETTIAIVEAIHAASPAFMHILRSESTSKFKKKSSLTHTVFRSYDNSKAQCSIGAGHNNYFFMAKLTVPTSVITSYQQALTKAPLPPRAPKNSTRNKA